jgi:lipoate-protein ligase A
MRLLNINYWAGKKQEPTLILLINIDDHGQLIGLRSDKLKDSDIKKIRDNIAKLNAMDPDELEEWLKTALSSFSAAVVRMKDKRYSVMEEHAI